MGTKERILEKALQLFNEKGITAVSSKHISDELGISYGNLCYHFPRKDDIILQLYFNMQQRVDDQFKNIEKEVLNFEFMLSRLKVLFEEIYRYKFIYLGITKVVRHFDHIKRHAQQQMQMRRELLHNVGDFLVEQGYMKPFKAQKHKDMLVNALLMITNSWVSDAETFYTGHEEDKVDYYMQLYFNLIHPFLTEKGREGFQKVYKPA
ncbi:TetR/AcrR family transcriptional regulator [Fulvivirga kasyanovii]|uniref:TetR/AcrR family transcriptional regulator n=1 Tax=Fulvivirga kasyanovii TaxID=396812 RepID=A0ABW9RYP2_9BACT|nr:TetR/AcrR family transcriptional regulator [Fulvivirga kasyanovii]MTI29128.1 TetR/AcrR family transcriptional regulator [Fulvivirga kasyanovii]